MFWAKRSIIALYVSIAVFGSGLVVTACQALCHSLQLLTAIIPPLDQLHMLVKCHPHDVAFITRAATKHQRLRVPIQLVAQTLIGDHALSIDREFQRCEVFCSARQSQHSTVSPIIALDDEVIPAKQTSIVSPGRNVPTSYRVDKATASNQGRHTPLENMGLA